MAEKIVAMILAGGKGTRLGALTKKIAKPAVSFGAKYRIIDFPLSNCANAGITTVGVLMQYESVSLDQYIGNGEKWGLNGVRSLTTTLTPRQTEEGLSWFNGTADAIYENLEFLDQCNPEHVLILSGDHIYSTSFHEMIRQHEDNDADLTISVIKVPMEEASRFGILVTDQQGIITEFQEKPKKPKSDLASMGIYIFKYSALKKYLIADHKMKKSSHDFGNDVIPAMLKDKCKLMAYVYNGYWKDVGTINSLHQANMDLLEPGTTLEEICGGIHVYGEDTNSYPQYVGPNAEIKHSLINQGTVIKGSVIHSVVSNEVEIFEGAKVENSVIMTGAKIKHGAVVKNAVVAPYAVVEENQDVIGTTKDIVLYAKKGE